MLIKYGKPVSMSKVRNRQKEIQNSETTKKACIKFYKKSADEQTSICRLCKSVHTHLFFKAYHDYLFFECNDCGALYLHNLPDTDLIYQGSEEIGCGIDYYGENQLFDIRVNQIVAPKVDFILDVCRQIDIRVHRWIDVGAGCGHLLEYARSLGIEVQGIESDVSQYNFMLNRGLNVKNIFLNEENLSSTENVDLSNADVVSLITVLEHMEKPAEFIKEIGKTMKSGSVLVIEVPRHPSLSAFANITHKNIVYRHITPPVHLQIFTEKSIEYLLDDYYEIVAKWEFGQGFSDMMNYSLIESGMEPTELFDLIMKSNNDIQCSIDKAGLADEMLVVARRK